jgi:hypothetical protein
MTLDEAIEVLTTENNHPWNQHNSALRAAVKLGIQALKAVKESRTLWGARGVPPLPGEPKSPPKIRRARGAMKKE